MVGMTEKKGYCIDGMTAKNAGAIFGRNDKKRTVKL